MSDKKGKTLGDFVDISQLGINPEFDYPEPSQEEFYNLYLNYLPTPGSAKVGENDNSFFKFDPNNERK